MQTDSSDVVELQDLAALRVPPDHYAVLGDPIAHSKSPLMQQAAFDHFKVSARYHRLRISPTDFSAGVQRLRELPFRGWNCTLPHKMTMVGLCDELSESGRCFGSVNTVVNRTGVLIGHNTDGIGWSRSLHESFQVHPADCRMLILGAGGASRAIAIQALAEGCAWLAVANRDEIKARVLIEELRERTSSPVEATLTSVALGDGAELSRALGEATLIVNGTSAGLDPTTPSILNRTQLHPHQMVFDSVYGAGAEKLRIECEAVGCRWCDGLGMLLHQGAEAFCLWTGYTPPIELMRRGLLGH